MNKLLLSLAIVATAATVHGSIEERIEERAAVENDTTQNEAHEALEIIKARLHFEAQYEAAFGEKPDAVWTHKPKPDCTCATNCSGNAGGGGKCTSS